MTTLAESLIDTPLSTGAHPDRVTIPAVIELRQVSKRYGSTETSEVALRDLNLRVPKGEFVIVAGPSGSGKSTLLNIAGLIDKASGGFVAIDDEDVSRLDDSQRAQLRAKRVGLIFQSFNLISVFSAIENVMLPAQVVGLNAGVARRRSMDMLSRFGLGGKVHARPDLLSGGQRQRVAICRALINDPTLLIADEPTANLDTGNAMQLMDALKRDQMERGLTVILATHDHRVFQFATRVVHLQDGRLHEEAPC